MAAVISKLRRKESGVCNGRGDLEVEAEGPVVEVGGADGCDGVVDEHSLFVEEAVLVAVELGTRLARIVEIGIRRQVDCQVVRLVGDQDAHVHAAQPR